MRWLALLLTMILATASQSIIVASDTSDDLAQQASAAYVKGDFKTAADLYQQLIDQGVKRSEVYFDLGNAYYQLHDLGRALVNYRRAEELITRDEDLRLNLARVRVQRVDGTSAEVGILGQITSLTNNWLSLSELGWIIIVLLWLCCAFIAAYLWRADWRKWVQWAIVVSATLFIVVSLMGLTRFFVDALWKPTVIVDDSVSVMTGPGTNYVEIFELHSAAELRIIEERNHWIRFQLPDLREGWIEERALEKI
jgi:tetratricopeptide (TPR) repeat protein